METKRSEGILAYIWSVYSSLTKAEKKVADVVLDEGNSIIYDSLTNLAEKAGVGDTSVLRFCRHIGYSGFQEFKLALAQDITIVKDDLERYNNNSIEDGSISSVTNKNIQLIEDTTNMLSEHQLSLVTNAVLEAKNVVFFGVGSSGLTAEHARYRFIRVGLPVEALTDGHLAPVRASLMSSKDVAIVISVSGSTVDIVEVAQIAKNRGAKVICITCHAKSPVTKYADIVLLTASKEKPTNSSTLSTVISQLHILEIIFVSTLNRLGDKGTAMLQNMAKITSKKLF